MTTPQLPREALLAFADECEQAAKDLRNDRVYGCCAGTYEHCAAHIRAALETPPPQPRDSALVDERIARAWKLVERWKSPVDEGEQLSGVERFRRVGFAAMLETALAAQPGAGGDGDGWRCNCGDWNAWNETCEMCGMRGARSRVGTTPPAAREGEQK